MRLRRDRCGHDLIFRCAGFAEGDVVAERAREEKDILLDDGDLLTQGGEIPIAHIHAVHEHLARGHVVGAVDQFGERGFARARLPDDGDGLTWFDFEGNILEHIIAAHALPLSHPDSVGRGYWNETPRNSISPIMFEVRPEAFWSSFVSLLISSKMRRAEENPNEI